MVVGDQRRAPAASSPGRETQYPLSTRLEGPQGRSGWEQKISPSLGFDPRIVRLVASRHTDWAISVHNRRTVVPYNQRSPAPRQTRPPTGGVRFVNCIYRRLGGNYTFIPNLKPCKAILMFTGFWKYFRGSFMEEEIRSGAVGWGTVAQARRSRVRFLPVALMALWSTQTLTNMRTRDMSRGRG